MKIAIISPDKSKYSETFIRASFERLKGEKFLFYGGHLPDHLDGYGRFFPGWRISHQIIDRISAKLGRARKYSDPSQVFERELTNRQVDVVLCHYMLTGLRCLDSCRRARIPMIIHCHGYDAHTTFAKKQWIDAVHEIGEYAHKIIAVSNTMIAALKEAGFPSEKIIHRPYGIDLERFGFSSRKSTKPVFTSVGRFIDKKAPHLLLMAFRKVLEQRPDARLEMIGDGPLLSPCYDLISEWNMQHAIDLAGVLPPSEVAERLRCSRAFVQHSISPKVGFLEGDHEGTPVAILEAAASGLPIVATRHAGIQEAVLDGESGYLVAERDVQTMSDRMLQLIDDPELAETMGKRGHAHIKENYSMPDYISCLQKIIEQAAETRGS